MHKFDISNPSVNEIGSALSFSDPDRVTHAPDWAVGQANREPDFDALPGFQTPPPGFGIVPFFWWLGDPLTQERLKWELEQMKGMGVSGYQINYSHADKGGKSYGLSMPSEPPLFSEKWWKLTDWFMREAKKQDAAISLSDYTLGPGQGWCIDQIVTEHPEIAGQRLCLVKGDAPAGALATTTLSDPDGKPETVSVCVKKVDLSIDPMNPISGSEYITKFFERFTARFPAEEGRGLNFFFSDELSFGVSGHLWNDLFPEEFKKRKGYDIVPELHALFIDIGPRTPKIRMDYNDVKVALTEEHFWKPVFDWHQARGMTSGCDHGGRGRDVTEFGDYFRTQRWNQGPGSDQPNLGKGIIKPKIASSIAHLYRRPRVWLEGFYGSGWGTSAADFVDATLANYVLGYNLLSLHGMYYATHGGWWEWAPPDNTFRMPYWRHLKGFMDCVQRLSFLLSQGFHRCDVAIIYPVAGVEAGMDGEASVKCAFATAETIYGRSIDFDFMDFESLARAKVVGKELHVAGEVFKILVFPAMKAVRHSTLLKALEFKRAGGIVIGIDALPLASDRLGLDDPEVADMVREIFPEGPVTAAAFSAGIKDLDYSGPGYVMHRVIGRRQLYALYNAPQGTEVTFRATGKVELWDPWTGEARPLPVVSRNASRTRLRLPLSEKEIQLIVFSPGKPVAAAKSEIGNRNSKIELEDDWEFELQPTSDNRFGDFHWPPTRATIGAEIRHIDYCEGDPAKDPWQKVTCTFGPQFVRHEQMPEPVTADLVKGKRVEFSWRYGIENDPGHQGYHGLKAVVHNELLVIGKKKDLWQGASSVIYEDDGSRPFLQTTVWVSRAMTAYAVTGALKPARVWLNGVHVSGDKLKLKAGSNTILLNYDQPGRAYFVVSRKKPGKLAPVEPELVPGKQLEFVSGPLASHWWHNPDVISFDVRPDEENPVGWYKFVSPPGFKAMTISAHGTIQAWADGKLMKAGKGKFRVAKVSEKPVSVLIRIDQERGCYGGAAFMEPIKLDCVPGQISLGDWSKIDGLYSYSGGAWYRKDIRIPKAKQVVLDLGRVVASAEIHVNGKLAGIKVSPPWSMDITRYVKSGKNRFEILVCNTLSNHYTSVPTRYRGSLDSGLFGPVSVQLIR